MSFTMRSFKRPWLLAAGAPLAVLALLAGVNSPTFGETAGERSTRNIVLGAAAVTAAIILNNNYQHKRQAHDTIVGRTRDGGTVYADGRIVYPNGDVLYAGDGRGRPCRWDGEGDRCRSDVTAYHPRGWERHRDRGRHEGHHKHGDQGDHGNNGDDDSDNDN